MELYNLRTAPTGFAITKFDADFNIVSSYIMEPKGAGYSCNCPANQRTVKLKPCRHQRMIRFMLGAVNTDRFYDPETGRWCQPFVGEPPTQETFTEPELPLQPPQATEQPTDFTPAEPLAQAREARPPLPPVPTSAPVVTRRI